VRLALLRQKLRALRPNVSTGGRASNQLVCKTGCHDELWVSFVASVYVS